MVLNKSKWDHKAKIQYLKKHGLIRPKPQAGVTPKWSSKKSSISSTLVLDDSDSEWDSDDEELISHFYPELSPQELPIYCKRKLKHQILVALAAREAVSSDETGCDPEFLDVEGIYLGTKPEAQTHNLESKVELDDDDDDFKYEISDLEAKIGDFLVLAKPQKSRKLLKAKFLGNFLEEYGIESLKDTVKNCDYNEVLKEQVKNIDKLDLSKLDGHRIGESFGNSSSNVRALSEEELREHLERRRKLEHVRFYNQIKAKFGSKDSASRNKVLEINNINVDDQQQLKSLNMRIERNGESWDTGKDVDDLDELLGLSKEDNGANDIIDLDELMLKSKGSSHGKNILVSTKVVSKKSHAHEDFLDNLLGA